MSLERFIPLSPDRFIRNSQDFEVAKFGHLNTIVEYINNNTVLPAGLNGYVQFNDNNALGGDPGLFWDNINKRLGVGTTTPLGILHLKSTAATTRMVMDGDASQNKIITYRTNGLQRFDLYVTDIAETGSNAGSNFSICAYSDAGTLLSTPLSINRASGQVTFDERLKLESDSTVTTQTSSVIQSSTTNANLVIAPNGTGALVASIPDGTATGGNARGTNAVDLQTSRTLNTQVAGGQSSVISGGANNRISSGYSFSTIGGGSGNVINSFHTFLAGINNSSLGDFSVAIGSSNASNGYASVAFGSGNVSSGSRSTISGGDTNTASSNFSTVSGGQSNTASSGTHATVVGGQSNTASGQHSVAGGSGNTASGLRSVAFGESSTASGSRSFVSGQSSTASGNNAVAIGGVSSIASGPYSTALSGIGNQSQKDYTLSQGYLTTAYLQGQTAFSGTIFASAAANCQQSNLVANREAALTTAATTVLSLDGTGVTNLIIPLNNNRAWNVQVNWVAIVTTITGTATGISVGDVVTSIDLLAFKKIAGVSSASAHTSTATKLMVTTPAAYAACAIAFTAGASQEMALTFTGPTFVGGGSVTMRVVARIELTEVAF
jgi:hypothetical protein